MRILIALALLSAPLPAMAACNYTSGNCYSSGGSTVYGSNSRTGSSWSSTSTSQGSRGTDSDGNSWSYNRNSGVYQNYGTGETRYRGSRD